MKINEVFENFNCDTAHRVQAIFSSIFVLQNRIQTAGEKIQTQISMKQWLLLAMTECCQEPRTLTNVGNLMGCSRQNIKKLALALEIIVRIFYRGRDCTTISALYQTIRRNRASRKIYGGIGVMKKARKKTMFIVLGILLALIGAIIIWLQVPYSPVKSDFQNDTKALIAENQIRTGQELFAKEDFLELPITIQKYIENCGYIGTSKMSYMKMQYHDVNFMQGKNGPALTIDYTQYNFVNEPCRMALIDSSMFGIPFEGYDYYQNGEGGMKGVIAKVITLFNQTGTDMDKACLATFLAESLFAPAILSQNYITFEQISDFEIRAVITYGGQTASGIFTFNENYEMISFTTNDRAVAGADGTMTYIPWSALCSEYQLTESGIKYPTKFQAVWNYPDGDFTYFDGIISEVSYGFR